MSHLNRLDSLLANLKNIISYLEHKSKPAFGNVHTVWAMVKEGLEILVPEESIQTFDEIDQTIRNFPNNTDENLQCRITCLQTNVPILIQILEDSAKITD